MQSQSRGRHVIEHQADFAAEQFAGVLYADLLCKLHLGVVELVHVAIDVVEVNIFIIEINKML